MGIFDNFRSSTGLFQPQSSKQNSTFIERLQDPRFLGLLAGAAATQRLGAAQGLQEGARVMQSYADIEERRKRKGLIDKLVAEGGFSKQEQALIAASQNPAAVAAQIRSANQSRADAAAAREATAAAKKPTFKEFDGNLYEVTPEGLVLAKKGSVKPEDTVFKEFDGNLYRVEGNKLILTKSGKDVPKSPTYREFDGNLYEVTSSGLNLVKRGTADPTTPLSTVGKIEADFNDGLITQEVRNQAIAKFLKAEDKAFSVTTPDGTTVTYGGAGGNTKLTEQQSKDLSFAARIPDELMSELDKYDSALASYGDQLLDQDPTGLVRGTLQNPDFQIAQTLSQQFLTPLIRKDTGAAIQAWETQLYTQMYFPRPGDTQEVIERKRDARRLAVDGLRKGLPPLLRIQVDPEFAKQFAQLQSDVLPEDSALRKITKDWAASTQPQGSLPSQQQDTGVQLESGPGLSIESMPFSDLINVNIDNLSDEEIDIMTKRLREKR